MSKSREELRGLTRELNQKIRRIYGERDSARARITDLEVAIAELRAEPRKDIAELDALRAEVERLTQRLEDKPAVLAMSEQWKDMERDRASLRAEVERRKGELHAEEAAHFETQADRDALRARLGAAKKLVSSIAAGASHILQGCVCLQCRARAFLAREADADAGKGER